MAKVVVEGMSSLDGTHEVKDIDELVELISKLEQWLGYLGSLVVEVEKDDEDKPYLMFWELSNPAADE
jgi:hypothetical protein